MISLNALITPGDNSIMIVAIKWGFHQDPQTEGGKAIIPPVLRYAVASNIMILGYLAEFMRLKSIHNACGEFSHCGQIIICGVRKITHNKEIVIFVGTLNNK